MLLAFLDESYDHARTGKTYVVGAAVFHGLDLHELEGEFKCLVQRAHTDHDVSASAELHGQEIFHGTGNWSAINGDYTAQTAYMRDALAVVDKSGAKVFAVATTPARLKLQHPHVVCLRYLLERIDEYAEEVNDYVVLIADDHPDKARYRQDLDESRAYSTGGYRPRRLDRIKDTINFGQSAVSPGLQAADIVAFSYRRVLMHEAHPLAAKAAGEIWSAATAPTTYCWEPLS